MHVAWLRTAARASGFPHGPAGSMRLLLLIPVIVFAVPIPFICAAACLCSC